MLRGGGKRDRADGQASKHGWKRVKGATEGGGARSERLVGQELCVGYCDWTTREWGTGKRSTL